MPRSQPAHRDLDSERSDDPLSPRPPSPRAPLVVVAVLAALLAVVVLVLVRPPGPLDQPDPANQRTGLLLEGPQVPAEVAGVAFGERPAVLLFLRDRPDPDRLRDWLEAIPEAAAAYVVLQQETSGFTVPGDASLVVDPQERLAAAVDLPTPQDVGPGVGYAVVDPARVVRYATLDPEWPANAFEVATIVGAVS